MSLQQVINELQAATAELKAANDYADWQAGERAKLERAMAINERTWRRAPRVVRNYDADTIAVSCES